MSVTEIQNWRKPNKEEIAWALSKLQPMAEALEGSPRSDEGWLFYAKQFLRIVQPIKQRPEPTPSGDKIHPAVPLEIATDALLDMAGFAFVRFPKPVQLRKLWMHKLGFPAADGVEMNDIEDEFGEVRL